MIEFTVWGTPMPQGSMKATTHKSLGRVRTFASNAKKLNPWRKNIQDCAALARRAPPLECAVRLTVTFWLKRPKTVKRAMPSVPPDTDKLVRAVGDSLTGTLLKDDAQITTIVAMKRYTDDIECAVIRLEEDE